MIVRHEVVKLPFELWLASTAVLIGSIAIRWLTYRHLLKATLRQALGGALAYLALTHVITVASLTALAGRDVPWRRTNKTKPGSQGWAALHAVRTELALGLACLTAAALMLIVNRNGGVATMLAIGLAVQGVTYLAAPTVAAIAEHDLRRNVGHLIENRIDGEAAVVVPGRVAEQGGTARWLPPAAARASLSRRRDGLEPLASPGQAPGDASSPRSWSSPWCRPQRRPPVTRGPVRAAQPERAARLRPAGQPARAAVLAVADDPDGRRVGG